jgi:hypothetical protein
MELHPTGQLLADIEQRQDSVLRQLDELNEELERTFLAFQRELRVVGSPLREVEPPAPLLAPVQMAALVNGA